VPSPVIVATPSADLANSGAIRRSTNAAAPKRSAGPIILGGTVIGLAVLATTTAIRSLWRSDLKEEETEEKEVQTAAATGA